jgi:hypothetical protein
MNGVLFARAPCCRALNRGTHPGVRQLIFRTVLFTDLNGKHARYRSLLYFISLTVRVYSNGVFSLHFFLQVIK